MNLPDELKGRSLLTLHDLSDDEMIFLLDLADRLKREKAAGQRGDRLRHKNIAMLFEKSSTRTRCATAVAAFDEGGSTEYLGSHEVHLGKKESVTDTARVLGRMFDGIMYRGYAQRTVEILAEQSGVPVWNALTDEAHPTQALADLMTVRETFGRLRGLKLAFIGDGRNNVATSLMVGCAKAGIDFVNCCPAELTPSAKETARAAAIAARHGASLEIVHDPVAGVRGANALYTDVWVSMGEEDQQETRMRLLKPYQVTMALAQATGNLEQKEVIFLHCLPAFHDHETKVTAETGALEVTHDVFEAPFSRVFDQAENRMHTIKALMVVALGERGP